MRHLLLFVFFMLPVLIQAQDQLNFHNARPPSPEVAALAKYVDIPMSYTSGTPQIGIPMFSARSGIIEVPIALSYNASGIRVEEAATWVGLGWNLSTGPTLSRIIRGLPDDMPTYGYMNSVPQNQVKYIDSIPPGSNARIIYELNLYPAGQLDIEPGYIQFFCFWIFGAVLLEPGFGKIYHDALPAN